MVAMAGSFLVSYAHARAQGIGLAADVGLTPRTERLILVIVGVALAGFGFTPGPHRHPRDPRRPDDRDGHPANLPRLAPEPGDRTHHARGVEHRGSQQRQGRRQRQGRQQWPSGRRRQGARRHRRRRQLRQQPRPGPLLLRRCEGRRLRPGPHARQPRRLPRPRHRVRGRLRHRPQQGRHGPLGGDLRRAEQHLSVRRRAAPRRARRARDDPRRARASTSPRSSRRRPARPPTSSASCASARST